MGHDPFADMGGLDLGEADAVNKTPAASLSPPVEEKQEKTTTPDTLPSRLNPPKGKGTVEKPLERLIKRLKPFTLLLKQRGFPGFSHKANPPAGQVEIEAVADETEFVADTPIIEVRNLKKEFKLGGENVAALRGVNFAIQRGEMVSIIGPSGSGKSTLLGLIGGLDTPTSGQVIIDGQDISRMNERQLTHIRNEKLGFVFQFFNLISTLTALENVALPIQFATKRQFNPTKRARELLTHLGLEDRLGHQPTQLSGGQQQRVAIARALANNPPLLLTDEPTGNLNTETGDLVLKTIKQLHADFKTTIIIVTHNPDIAKQTERILQLVDGEIVEV